MSVAQPCPGEAVSKRADKLLQVDPRARHLELYFEMLVSNKDKTCVCNCCTCIALVTDRNDRQIMQPDRNTELNANVAMLCRRSNTLRSTTDTMTQTRYLPEGTHL